jgi:GNAT superfamily N-acetyltransferase
MTDMLVKLYELPSLAPYLAKQEEAAISIRRALVPEKHHILQWVGEHFGAYWVSETDVALSRSPVSCFIAVANEEMIGFACYDTTRLGFFGPTGVGEAARGKGTGAALLLACLHDMWAKGYGYAVIGGVGPEDFYAKHAGATVIPDSTPGIYAGMLRPKEATE